jgi:transcription-repair coupling factor (superfamily II helicase)
MNQRLMIYRQLASARREDEVERTLAEVRDRYGPLTSSLLNLAEFSRIRILADRLGIEAIDREGQVVVIRFREQARVDPQRLVSLVNKRGDVTLVPPGGLKLDLRAPADRAAVRPKAPPAAAAKRAPEPKVSAWPNLGRKPVTSSDLLRRPEAERVQGPRGGDLHGRGGSGQGPRGGGGHGAVAGARLQPGASSWWTARANSGEVAPGFSKAEILRPEAEDPRAENGVFTRVAAVLGDLAGRPE